MARSLHLVGPHGYTGRLAHALCPQAVPVGRRPDAPGLCGDITDPGFAAEVAESASGVVNLVGPFNTWSRVLARACAEAGTDYVDITGEPHFVAWSRRVLHPIAQRTGARLLHAVATESLPAMLLAVEAGPGSVALRYRMHLPLMSPGSRITAALSTTRSPIWARAGAVVEVPEGDRQHPASDGVWSATSYPDVVLLPLLGHPDVVCWLYLRRWAARQGPRPTADELWAAHRARDRPGPPASLRQKTEVRIELEVDGQPAGTAVVRDSYRFTAAAAVTVARALSEHPGEGGVLAVPQVVPAAGLWEALEPYGLSRS